MGKFSSDVDIEVEIDRTASHQLNKLIVLFSFSFSPSILHSKGCFLAVGIHSGYVKLISETQTNLQSCIILHNMMVQVQQQWDENEDHTWYAFRENHTEQ